MPPSTVASTSRNSSSIALNTRVSHATKEESSGSALNFSIVPVNGAKLSLHTGESLGNQLFSSDHGDVLHYSLAGPSEALDCLYEVLDGGADVLENVMSPVSTTTVTGAQADKIGVPEGAFSFAFSYAFASLHGKQQRLLEIVAARLGEQVLTERPAWLSFVLTGGFIYFDSNHQLLAVNALCLQHSSAAANMTLVGPYAACAAAGEALGAQNRLQAVAIPELRASGFDRFGWVFKVRVQPSRPLKPLPIFFAGASLSAPTEICGSTAGLLLSGREAGRPLPRRGGPRRLRVRISLRA